MANPEVQENYNMLLLATKQLEDISVFFQDSIKQYSSLSDPALREIIKDNEYTLQESIEWKNRIDSFNKKRTLEHSNELDKRLIISIAAILMGYSKDKIVTRENDQTIIKISEDAFKDFNKHFHFFEEKNQKVYFGDIDFATTEEAFHFLRNKLLHGEYVIENGKIVIKSNNKQASIYYNTLLEYAKNYEDLSCCNNKEYKDFELLGEFQNLYIMAKKGTYDNHDFFKHLIVGIDLNFKMKGTKVHNLKTIKICKEFIEEFKKINAEQGYRIGIDGAYKETLKKYGAILSSNKIIPELTRRPGYIKSKVAQSIVKNDNYIRKTETNLNPIVIQNLIDDFLNKASTSPIFHLQSLVNLITISSLQFTQKEKKEKPTYIDPKTGIALLNFYTSIIYPSETMLWHGNGTEITDVFDGNLLDFSKLNLNQFVSTGPVVNEKTWSTFENKKKELTRNFNVKKNKYQKLLENLNDQLKKGTTNPKSIEKISALVDFARKEYEKALSYKEKLDSFDYNKFMDNLNIIFHIRNMIAHGNYRIVPDINPDGDIKYRIQGEDILNGVTTYSIDIPIEELYNLSSQVREATGITNSEEWLDTLKNETYKNELIKATFVDQNKKDEWIKLVNECYTNQDYAMLNTLRIAKELVDEIDEPFITEHISYDKYLETIGTSLSTLLCFGSTHDDESESLITFGGISITSSKYKEIMKIIMYYIDPNSFIYSFLNSEELNRIYKEDSFIRKMLDEYNKSRKK